MLDRDRIRALFALFCDLAEEELPRWEALYEAAARYLETRLRPEVDTAAEMEVLCTTSGALAYADYLLLAGGGGCTGTLRVGDISLGESTAQKQGDAAEIRAYFLSSVAHLLLPKGAVLLAVGEDA